MPEEPGRFKSSGLVVTHDQQINPQWQGPRFCDNYASQWQDKLAATEVHWSEFVIRAQETLHPHIANAIELALATGEKGKTLSVASASVPRLALPAIPSYSLVQGRSKLRLVLRAFAGWNSRVGYNPIVAALAAQIMAVTGREKLTFQILVAGYKKYRLKDYFEGTEAAKEKHIMRDVEALWQSVHLEWPDLAFLFGQYAKGEEFFKNCTKSLLSTLLTETHHAEMQPFEWHVRLLHHILLPVGEYSPKDPRAQLRRTVMQIMARHMHNFLKCKNEEELEKLTEHVSRYVHVDLLLVKLLAKEPTVPKVHLAPSLVGGSAIGTLSYEVASNFLPSLGAPVHVILGLSATAAGTVGGLRASKQWSVEGVANENRELLAMGNRRDEKTVVAIFDIFDSCIVA
eukprot:Skav200909  [mRNA]  locus=scaffold1581:365879:367078:+ [translate_table: standard]